MAEAKKDAVVAARWVWKASGAQPKAHGGMPIQIKASLQGAAMLAFAFLLFHFRHHHVMPVILCVLAALTFIGGFLYPPLFHGFEKFGALLAKWVASGLTWGLLVPFYYIGFVAGRAILTVAGKDPMTRAFPTKAPTYWIPRPPVRNIEQYKKQH